MSGGSACSAAFRVDGVRRHPVHLHPPAVAARARCHSAGARALMVQEGERQRRAVGVGAFEAGAADHHVDAVHQHIGPDAVPEQLDRALVAVGLQDAGAAELEKAQIRLAAKSGARSNSPGV